jgi:glycosyltransferase 2 family protein
MMRSAALWLGIGVSVVFAYVAVKDADGGEVWQALTDAELAWLVPVIPILALAFFLRAVRWQSLYAPGRKPRLVDVTRALFVGYLFNALLPVRAGEAARVFALRRRGGASLAETTGTVVVERAFDVLSLLFLLFLMLPWLPALGWTTAAATLAIGFTMAIAVTVAVLLLWGERLVEAAVRLLERIPVFSQRNLAGLADQILAGLAGLRAPGIAIVAFGWTMLSWLVVGLGYWLLMFAFDIDVSPLAGLLVVIAIGLAMILPSSPAALGVFEGATVIALAAYGIDESAALSYALVLHALSIVPFVLLAPAVLPAYRGALRFRGEAVSDGVVGTPIDAATTATARAERGQA